MSKLQVLINQAMVEEIEQWKIAAGSYHSCLIAKKHDKEEEQPIDRLYVWGLNNERHLVDSKEHSILTDPHKVKLICNDREYEPVSVVNGPTYSLVIGEINLEKETKWLKKKKMESKKKDDGITGNPILGALPISELYQRFKYQQKFPQKMSSALMDASDDMSQIVEQNLKLIQSHFREKLIQNNTLFGKDTFPAFKFNEGNQDRSNTEIDKQTLFEVFKEQQFESKEFLDNKQLASEDIKEAVEVIMYPNQRITMQQFEDFCLGFQQEANKLFIFGKCEDAITNSTGSRQIDPQSSSEASSDESNNKSKMVIMPRPQVIKFNRFEKRIIQVACGQSHILALTVKGDILSWGCGSYGALGFGENKDIQRPTYLKVKCKKHSSQELVKKIACGKFHSMCLTEGRSVYSWGQGLYGRLGHGNEEEQSVPKEIQSLTNLLVIDISAGDAHSAAVTQSGKLYTWGNGAYGRLGTGFELKELAPQLVDDMSEKEVIRVSCGALHTLCLTIEGKLWSFGHNKYGKLGLKQIADENQSQPQKVSLQSADSSTFIQIVAGQNHSLAIANYKSLRKQDSLQRRFLAWGYNGYNLLGRGKEKVSIEPCPISMDCKIQSLALSNAIESAAKDVLRLREAEISTSVSKVSCSQYNTLVLLDQGELFICGSSKQGQMCIEADPEIPEQKDSCFKEIRFFSQMQHKVKSIACGTDHILALLSNERVYGWGKNNQGQLGLDNLNSPQRTPKEVPISCTVSKIYCGSDYSCILTKNENILVCGSMNNGKLGLSKAQRDGQQQTFVQIPNLDTVLQVSCGPEHMIAICKKRRCYAWGKNDRGQLGIGNKENQYVPRKIADNKQEEGAFKKIECGTDFSVGLTIEGFVHVWGNRRYLGAQKSYDSKSAEIDAEEPVHMQVKNVKDIYCCGPYALIQLHGGSMYQVGEFQKLSEGKQGEKKKADWDNELKFDVSDIERTKASVKFLALGPTHLVAVTAKDEMYGWGTNDEGQLGIGEQGDTKHNCIKIEEINKILVKNAEHLQKYPKRKDSVQMKHESSGQSNQSSESDSDSGSGSSDNSEESKSSSSSVSVRDVKIRPGSKLGANMGLDGKELKDKRLVKQLAINELSVSDDQFQFEEQHRLIQEEVKNENKQGLSEKQMSEQDIMIQEKISQLLTYPLRFYKVQQKLKIEKTHIKCSFMQRVQAKPFYQPVDMSWPEICYNANRLEKFKRMKKQLKGILQLIHMHPCYLQKLYFALKKDEKYDAKQFNNILKLVYPTNFIANVDSSQLPHKNKDLFTLKPKDQAKRLMSVCSERERVNFLLISFVKKIIEVESDSEKWYLPNVRINFTHEESVVARTFARIFKSQELNICSLGIFGAHFVVRFKDFFSQYDDQQTSVPTQKQLNRYFDFVQKHMIEVWFSAGNERCEVEFSESVNIFIKMMFETLMSKIPSLKQQNQQDNKAKFSEYEITMQILSLIFKPFRKMVEQFEIYILPHIKGGHYYSELLKPQGELRKDLVFILDIFESYIHLKKYATKKIKVDFELQKQIESQIERLRHSTCKKMLKTMMKQDHQLMTLPYKNFEALLLHSMGGQKFTVSVNEAVVHDFIQLIEQYKDNVMIVVPSELDPLLMKVQFLLKNHKQTRLVQRYYLTINTRLMGSSEDESADAQCCPSCHAVLPSDTVMLVSDSQPIFKNYVPEDQEMLFSIYGQLLKRGPDLKKNEVIWKQLNKHTNMKTDKDNLVLQKFIFLSKHEIERKKNQNKIQLEQNDGERDAQQDGIYKKKLQELRDKAEKYRKQLEDKQVFVKTMDDEYLINNVVMYQMFKQMKNQLVEQINLRRKHLTMVQVTRHRIESFLETTLNKNLSSHDSSNTENPSLYYHISCYNHQLGIANHELKDMHKVVSNFSASIMQQSQEHQFSQGLFKILQEPQKVDIRAILKKNASNLRKKKTVTKVMDELKGLLDKCTVMIMETEERQISIKLVHEQQSSASCLKAKIQKHQLLYSVNLDCELLYKLRAEERQHQFYETYFLTESKKCLAVEGDIKERIKSLRVHLFSEGQSVPKAAEIKNKKKIQDLMQQMGKELERKNRICFPGTDDCIVQFDKTKLLKLINKMLKSRYAYVFNCHKSPKQLVLEHACRDQEDNN